MADERDEALLPEGNEETQAQEQQPLSDRDAAVERIAAARAAEILGNAAEPVEEPDEKPAVEAQEEAEAEEVEAAEPVAAEEPVEEQMVKLIIDGKVQDVPLSKVMEEGKRALQMEIAADKRLEEAKKLLREAKERSRAPKDDEVEGETPRANQPATISDLYSARDRLESQFTQALLDGEPEVAVKTRSDINRINDAIYREQARMQTEVVRAETRRAQTLETVAKKQEEFAKEHPDYFNVVSGDLVGALQQAPVVWDAIMAAEESVHIAYELGKDLSRAQKLLSLASSNPLAAVMEVGKLAATAHGKPGAGTIDLAARREAKRGKEPLRGAGKLPERPEAEKPQSREQIIAEMAARRATRM